MFMERHLEQRLGSNVRNSLASSKSYFFNDTFFYPLENLVKLDVNLSCPISKLCILVATFHCLVVAVDLDANIATPQTLRPC